MQHIENGIAVKAVVARLKSEGQACTLNQSRLGKFLWAVCILLESYSAGHKMRCEGLVLSKRRVPGLFENPVGLFKDGNTTQKDNKSCFSFLRNYYVCCLI